MELPCAVCGKPIQVTDGGVDEYGPYKPMHKECVESPEFDPSVLFIGREAIMQILGREEK